MRYKWKNSDSFETCKAFVTKDYIYVRRDFDRKWSCFSKWGGWQDGVNDAAFEHFKKSEKVFFSGDTLEWEFLKDD